MLAFSKNFRSSTKRPFSSSISFRQQNASPSGIKVERRQKRESIETMPTFKAGQFIRAFLSTIKEEQAASSAEKSHKSKVETTPQQRASLMLYRNIMKRGYSKLNGEFTDVDYFRRRIRQEFVLLSSKSKNNPDLQEKFLLVSFNGSRGYVKRGINN